LVTSQSSGVLPIAADYQATLRLALSQRPQIRALAGEVVTAGLQNVFLVGVGASLVAMYPTAYLLERHSRRAPVFQLSSNEFVFRQPATMGAGSLVVVSSHTGTTAETVEAARLARRAGATVVAISRDTDSPLAEAANATFVYRSEDTITDAKLILIGQLGLAILDRSGDFTDYAGAMRTFDALPEALYATKLETESRNDDIARQLQDEPITYVLGSGPSFGTAYLFAMCFLQEMQWMHAAALNAGEFFHGAMEMVTEDVAVIVVLGEDETRPMAERAQAFVRKHSRKGVFIDSRDLRLPGIEPMWRPLVSPFGLSAVLTRLASHYAAVRGHSLDLRRYMFKEPY
jgi:fructoselysine 6-phosphate deglycase